MCHAKKAIWCTCVILRQRDIRVMNTTAALDTRQASKVVWNTSPTAWHIHDSAKWCMCHAQTVVWSMCHAPRSYFVYMSRPESCGMHMSFPRQSDIHVTHIPMTVHDTRVERRKLYEARVTLTWSKWCIKAVLCTYVIPIGSVTHVSWTR